MHCCLVRSPFPTIRYVLCLAALVAAGCDRVPGVSPPTPVTLRLSPDTATLPVHGSLRLSATVTDGGFRDTAVGYRSSDTAVAVVDRAGTVRVVGYGSAWIVGTVLSHPTATDSVQVRVPAPAGPYLVLLPETTTVALGWSGQVSWRVGHAADAAVRLTSSDTSVVEARSSGLLCPRRLGSAVVRASLAAYPAVTDSTRVRVLSGPSYSTETPPPTASIASIVDSAGKAVDLNAVRGPIRVNVNVDTPPWPCLPPYVLQLLFDGKLWQTSPPYQWGGPTFTYSFPVDTRATDGAGLPLLRNGTHTLSVAGRRTDGMVMMSTSLSIVVAN